MLKSLRLYTVMSLMSFETGVWLPTIDESYEHVTSSSLAFTCLQWWQKPYFLSFWTIVGKFTFYCTLLEG